MAEGENRELSRKELQGMLEQALALNATQAEQISGLKTDIAEMREQMTAPRTTAADVGTLQLAVQDLQAELARTGKRSTEGTPQGEAKLTPYSGPVQATEDCHIGGVYRYGPNANDGRPRGDVFDVVMPGLWSDDPFVPVRVVGRREDGSLITELREDVPRVDFRFRVNTGAAVSGKASGF